MLFFVQTTSNQEPKKIQINQDWRPKTFNSYIQMEFEVSLPLGFNWWSEKLGFKIQNLKAWVEPNTSVFKLLMLLRENRNQTVNLVIPPGIYKAEITTLLAKKFLFEKNEIDDFFNHSDIWVRWGGTKEMWPSWIIPNTYNFSLNNSLEELFERLKKEHQIFWTQDRLDKLKNQKLNINELTTIASIVEKESQKPDEYEKIAGVYINRLRINMPLGADPTLVFIRGKGGRVYHKDIQIPSPYNTYLNKGLPPGPICIPSIKAIDATLNYKEHSYLYFCANSDLSGYHLFEKSYEKHLKNARKFQAVLNKQKK